MSHLEIKSFTSMEEIADVLAELELQIFDKPFSRETLIEKSHNKKDLLILVAFFNSKPCGFKAGYRQEDIFYSWIGGVIPSARNQGIAQKLMDFQHEKVRKLGFKRVQTKTRNLFKSMLILNIKNGFDIVETFPDPKEGHLMIVLEKEL